MAVDGPLYISYIIWNKIAISLRGGMDTIYILYTYGFFDQEAIYCETYDKGLVHKMCIYVVLFVYMQGVFPLALCRNILASVDK